jgi:hypothetical protein
MNPNDPRFGINVAALRARARRPWTPQSGIDASQGNPFAGQPSLADTMPIGDPGVNLQSWVNPYSFTIYQSLLGTSQATRIAPPNLRRAYLILQNQGPGNVYLNFGQDATAPTLTQPSNCMQLITTQFYEQIGGGGYDLNAGVSRPSSFVSPDYVSAITDTAGTTIITGEGVWVNRSFTSGR